MFLGRQLAHWLRLDTNVLEPYRDRIVARLSLLAAVLLTPFTVAHLLQQKWLLAAVIGAAQAVLMLDGLAARRGRRPPVPMLALAIALACSVVASLWLQGIHGGLWAYPALFICYFILPRGAALCVSGALLVAVSLLASLTLGIPTGARMAATLGLTLVMINVVLNVIGDLQQVLQDQASTDALTGAFNRRQLDSEFARMHDGAAQSPNHAMLAIDIDHFKKVNDTHGHGVGDQVLRGVAAEILLRKRKDDMLFRVGGEEFVMLLPNCGAEDALRIADELHRRIESADLCVGRPVTVSIGVATRLAGESLANWSARADAALYRAKREGRNRVVSAGGDGTWSAERAGKGGAKEAADSLPGWGNPGISRPPKTASARQRVRS